MIYGAFGGADDSMKTRPLEGAGRVPETSSDCIGECYVGEGRGGGKRGGVITSSVRQVPSTQPGGATSFITYECISKCNGQVSRICPFRAIYGLELKT